MSHKEERTGYHFNIAINGDYLEACCIESNTTYRNKIANAYYESNSLKKLVSKNATAAILTNPGTRVVYNKHFEHLTIVYYDVDCCREIDNKYVIRLSI